MNRLVSEKMWISDYNDELRKYIENVSFYGVLKNMNFFVKNK
jgi:hypothetical protein